MSIRSRITKLEKIKHETYKKPVLCFTDMRAGTMSIGEPINYKGSIEEAQKIIDKKGFSVINIIDDIM